MNPYNHNPFQKKAPTYTRESRSEFTANLQLSSVAADRREAASYDPWKEWAIEDERAIETFLNSVDFS